MCIHCPEHESPILLGSEMSVILRAWNVLGLDLRGGCFLLPTLTLLSPLRLIFVSYRDGLCCHKCVPWRICLGLGSTIGSSSLRIPEFLGRNRSSGCPEYLTLGREEAKGF